MSDVRTYSPAEVTISLALSYDLSNFSPDSLISISRDKSFFNTTIGSSGGVERTHQPGNVYTMNISLAQTSPSNALLSAIATLDDLSRFGVFPIIAKDDSGSTVFFSPSCWIEDEPEVNYTNNIETREWSIKCAEVVFDIGGNGDTSEVEGLSSIVNLVGELRNLFD
jgi:hypothetical protein